MGSDETGYKRFFGYGLAERLAAEITAVRPGFPAKDFLSDVDASDLVERELLGRVEVLAALLRRHLPQDYLEALDTLVAVYGPENPNETGMFTFGYWLWPVGTFIARYGLDHYEPSVAAIEELTKRHTGEYAIRPYIVARPEQTSGIMYGWAGSSNVHVRRLASEGLRPRLPWARRLTVFVEDPAPAFAVLEQLKDDPSRFVQKSVANHLNDYLKDNRPAAMERLRAWAPTASPQRRWIIRHALRNERKRGDADALAIIARSEQ